MKTKSPQWMLALLGACWFSLAIALPALAAKPNTSQSSYISVTLDERSGYARSWVNEVREANSELLCVGSLSDVDQAVLWRVSPAGSGLAVTTHMLADGQFAVATAVNSHAEIVGDDIQSLLTLGLYWPSPSGAPLVLPALAGDNGTSAAGINDAGVIVGRSVYGYVTYDTSGNMQFVENNRAVAWRAVVVDDAITVLGPYVLGPQSGVAWDINDCDADGIARVVGATDDGPVGWTLRCQADGSLAVLAGPVSLVPQSLRGRGMARGISNSGHVCGQTRDAVAFRTFTDATFEELSTPKNAFSEARGINDAGQVVGRVSDARKGDYGAMWQADGDRIDLNSVLGRSSNWRRIWWATSITPTGIISATGALNTDGENSRALLLIPK